MKTLKTGFGSYQTALRFIKITITVKKKKRKKRKVIEVDIWGKLWCVLLWANDWFIWRQACNQWVFLPTAYFFFYIFFFFFLAHSTPLSCLVRANPGQRWTKQAGVTELNRGGRLRHAGRHRLGQEHSPHQGDAASVFQSSVLMRVWYFAAWPQSGHTSASQGKERAELGLPDTGTMMCYREEVRDTVWSPSGYSERINEDWVSESANVAAALRFKIFFEWFDCHGANFGCEKTWSK